MPRGGSGRIENREVWIPDLPEDKLRQNAYDSLKESVDNGSDRFVHDPEKVKQTERYQKYIQDLEGYVSSTLLPGDVLDQVRIAHPAFWEVGSPEYGLAMRWAASIDRDIAKVKRSIENNFALPEDEVEDIET